MPCVPSKFAFLIKPSCDSMECLIPFAKNKPPVMTAAAVAILGSGICLESMFIVLFLYAFKISPVFFISGCFPACLFKNGAIFVAATGRVHIKLVKDINSMLYVWKKVSESSAFSCSYLSNSNRGSAIAFACLFNFSLSTLTSSGCF